MTEAHTGTGAWAWAWPALVTLGACGGEPAGEVPAVDRHGMEASIVAAIEEATAAVLARPRDAGVWGELAMTLHAHGEMAAAATAYARARALDADEARWPYQEARIRAETDPERAVALLREAARRAPEVATVHARLGDELRVLGRLDEAEAAYNRALGVAPDDARALLGRGQVALARGEPERARAALERTVELAPRFGAAWAAVASLRARLGDTTGAARAAAMARALGEGERPVDPWADEVLARQRGSVAEHRRGVAALARGQLDEALDRLGRACAAQPDDTVIAGAFAQALLAAGRLDDAEERLRALLERAPADAAGHATLGVTLARAGRLGEALGHFERAAELEPGDPGLLDNLGLTHERLGDVDAARATYERGRARFPHDPRFADRLAALDAAGSDE